MMRYLLIFLFSMFVQCEVSPYDESTVAYSENAFCLTPEYDDTYELLESYFDSEEVLTHSVAITYFTNNARKPLTKEYLVNRLDYASQFFEEAHRKFVLDSLEIVVGEPSKVKGISDKIAAIETITGENRDDLRDVFHIVHHKFWNSIFHKDGMLNIYIYDDIQDGYPGVAGGVGSTFASIQARHMHPKLKTLEHEIGHQLGLYHTHSPDKTNGLNNDTGDRVCDTYTSEINLYEYMSENCVSTGELDIPRDCLEVLMRNIMSYNIKSCRDSFTMGQIDRMKKVLETTYDLRSTVKELQLPTFNIPTKVLTRQ